jgi:uncharacterized protein (TIGR02145 family)
MNPVMKENNNDSDQEGIRLYSQGQVLLATLLGNPVAGAILMARNHRLLGSPRKSTYTIVIGIVFTLVLMGLLLLLSKTSIGLSISVLSLAAVMLWYHKALGRSYKNHIEHGGQKARTLHAAGIGAGFLLGYVAIVLVVLLVIPNVFKKKTPFDELRYLDGWPHGIFVTAEGNERFKGIAVQNFENGQINWRAEFDKGIFDGKYEEWDSGGQKIHEIEYSEGERDGHHLIWAGSTGHKIAEFNFEKGQLAGPFRTWYKSGQRKGKGAFIYGKNTGLWTYWNENGDQTHEFEFEKGHLIAMTRDGKRVEFGEAEDIDGNIYPTISIGEQEWMAENLRVTHFRNGDTIPNVTDNDMWNGYNGPAFCVYDNDAPRYRPSKEGLYYNWFAVVDSRNIAPEGWHVPTDEEWKELEIYLGISQAYADSTGWRGTYEGDKLKEVGSIYWSYPNLYADNITGFSAVPVGYRSASDGEFARHSEMVCFWSTSTDSSHLIKDAETSWLRMLYDQTSQIGRYSYHKGNGFSVRCVRDRVTTGAE